MNGSVVGSGGETGGATIKSQMTAKKLTRQALAGLDLSVRSTSEPPKANLGFTSVIDELFA